VQEEKSWKNEGELVEQCQARVGAVYQKAKDDMDNWQMRDMDRVLKLTERYLNTKYEFETEKPEFRTDANREIFTADDHVPTFQHFIHNAHIY